MSLPVWTRVPVLVAKTVVRSVFVEPVREGRLDWRRWPPGLLPLAVLAGVGYVVAAGLALFAGPLRAVDSLVNSYESSAVVPQWSSTVLLILVTLALALITTGALHAAWYVKLMVWLAVFMVLLPSTVGPYAFLGPLTLLGLVVLFAVRWRRSFAWWEFPVATLLIWVGMQLPWLLMPEHQALGLASGPALLAGLLQTLMMLAFPALIAGGVGLAQISLLAVSSAHATLSHSLARRGWWVVAAGLLGWRGADVALGVRDGARWLQPAALVSAAAVLALAGGFVWLVLRAARRPLPGSVGDVANELGQSSLLIGVGVTWPFLVFVPGAVVSAVAAAAGWTSVASATQWFLPLLRSHAALTVLRALVGLAFVVVAVRLARRGRTALAVGFAAFAAGTTLDLVSVLGNLDVRVVAEPLCVLGAVLAVALAAWRASARRFDGYTAWGLGLVLVVCAVYPHRQVLADPVSAVLGFSGLGVLLFGLVWRVLTDGASANGDSRAFPRAARVLLFLGYAQLAIILVAHVALTRTPGGQFDVGALADRGDEFIGSAMLVAAILIGLAALVRQPRTGG